MPPPNNQPLNRLIPPVPIDHESTVLRTSLYPRIGRELPRVATCVATPVQRRYNVCSSKTGESEFGKWSGARDLNPGPHGPEIYAVSSTETVFEGFEFISRPRQTF